MREFDKDIINLKESEYESNFRSRFLCVKCRKMIDNGEFSNHVNQCCKEFLINGYLSEILNVHYFRNIQSEEIDDGGEEDREFQDFGKIFGYMIIITESDIFFHFNTNFLLFGLFTKLH